jgi:hypothetical protein
VGSITKFSPSGTALWSARIDGTLDDNVQSLALDRYDNIFGIGYSSSTSLSFYHANGVAGRTLTKTLGGSMAFVCRYSTDGDLVFAVKLEGDSADYGLFLAADLGGGTFAFVMFASTSIKVYNWDGSVISATVTKVVGGHDSILVKYTSSGDYQWLISFTGSGEEKARATTTDSAGNVYAAVLYSSASMTITYPGGTLIYIDFILRNKINDDGKFGERYCKVHILRRVDMDGQDGI